MKFNRTGLRLLFSIQAGDTSLRETEHIVVMLILQKRDTRARYRGSPCMYFLLSSISPDRVPCLASNENPNLTRDNEASRLSGGLVKGTAQDEDCSTRRPPKRKVSQTHLEASWFNSWRRWQNAEVLLTPYIEHPRPRSPLLPRSCKIQFTTDSSLTTFFSTV